MVAALGSGKPARAANGEALPMDTAPLGFNLPGGHMVCNSQGDYASGSQSSERPMAWRFPYRIRRSGSNFLRDY